MIRFLFTNAFIVIFSAVCIVYSICLSLLDKKAKIMHFYAVAPWSKTILWVCGIKLKVNGLENITAGRPYIFISNHMSYFDIFALLAVLPVDFKFILKKELMKIPLFGWAVGRAQHISIDRKNPREAIKSMNEAAVRIKNGTSVLWFPEGTRSDGHLLPFKKGGFQLALKSGCDIIPLRLKIVRILYLKRASGFIKELSISKSAILSRSMDIQKKIWRNLLTIPEKSLSR